jgi:group I intron endonuclease
MGSGHLKTGVYVIANQVNGKLYVGSSAQSFAVRFRQHRSQLRRGIHHSRHLQAAWNKYGEDAFEFLVVCETSPEQAVAMEQVYMDRLKPEYNVLPRAGSALGRKMPEAAKAKIGAKSKRQWEDADYRARIVAAIVERKTHPDERQRVSESQKQSWRDPASRQRRIKALRAVADTAEFRAKVSDGTRRGFTPEVLERCSEGQKRSWSDPDSRARRVDALRAATRKPEARERAGRIAKARWDDPAYRERMKTVMTGPKRETIMAKTKYTPEFKAGILAALAAGKSHRAVAAEFGVDYGSVGQISRGVHWTDKCK